MHDGSRIARLVEMSRAGLDRNEPSGTGRVLDALAAHVADLPDDVLAEMVRAAAILAGWAAGVQARAAGELVLRSEGFTGFEQATTMVSGELRETRKTGRAITVRAAAGLSHPVVIDHLSTGRIDAPRADALLLAGRSLTDEQRAEAIEELLPMAPERSAQWLANEMRKRARSLDPGKASKTASESRAVLHATCEGEIGRRLSDGIAEPRDDKQDDQVPVPFGDTRHKHHRDRGQQPGQPHAPRPVETLNQPTGRH
jgi:hypothetical protein